jgi:DNA-binding NarL/FixJ family response regulator
MIRGKIIMKIVLLEKSPLLGQAIARQLENQAELIIITDLNNNREVDRELDQFRPAVVIIDFDFGNYDDQYSRSGHEDVLYFINRVRFSYPETKLVVLSTFIEERIIQNISNLRIQGYFLIGDEACLHLQDIIRLICAGGCYYTEKALRINVIQQSLSVKPLLTPRQIDVLKTIVINPEASYDEHARSLGISKYTFDTHLRAIFRKLGTNNLTAAVIISIQAGIIPYGLLTQTAVRTNVQNEISLATQLLY